MTDRRPESRKLSAVRRACRRGGKGAWERNWARLLRHGFPLVERIPGEPEKRLVTFMWRPQGRAAAPSIYSPIANIVENETPLHPLGIGGVWYRSFPLSVRTRASYGFSKRPLPGLRAGEAAWMSYLRTVRPDPLNPNRIDFEKSPDDPQDFAMTMSLVELPRAARQGWSRVRGPSRWTEEHHRIRSSYLRNTRSVWVELPRAYDPRRVRYSLLIVFDGLTYRSSVPTPRIVENLVTAGRIPPTVVLLVGNAPHARTKELGGNPAFAEFLARELLPWVRRHYRLSTDPSRTVLAGSSLGGVASAHAALRYPQLFGNVLAQSGAFQFPVPSGKKKSTTLMEQYAHAARLPIRFYLDAGTHESETIAEMAVSLLGSVRHLRDVLEAKGYAVTYAEFEGGHDYVCWRGTLAEGLRCLLARG